MRCSPLSARVSFAVASAPAGRFHVAAPSPMSLNFLDFERPIAELEAKIEELRHVDSDSGVNIGEEIDRLRSKSEELTRSIFGKLTPWQIARLARHPQRPYTLDYLGRIFTEFIELQGDRYFAEDGAIASGMARLDGRPVVVVGHQKGRTTKENIDRNFGMPRPEGYRKALRLFELAERFRMPVITFIDTPGAYPGVGAEERGTGRGDRPQSARHVDPRCPDPRHRHRGRRLGRRPGDRRRRLRDDAPVQHLLRDLPRGLRLDPVEERGTGGGRRAGDGHHLGSAPRAGAHRPDHRGSPSAARTATPTRRPHRSRPRSSRSWKRSIRWISNPSSTGATNGS